MQIDSVKIVPDWFLQVLKEWAIEYGQGSVIDLSARSATQIIWAGSSGRSFSTTADERKLVNDAYRDLTQLNDIAASVLDFYYLQGRQSVLELELKFKISNRAARQYLSAAQASIYYGYRNLNRAA